MIGEVKLKFTSQLITELQAIIAEHGDLPVFTSGEFITIPDAEVSGRGFEWIGGDSEHHYRETIFPEGEKAVLL